MLTKDKKKVGEKTKADEVKEAKEAGGNGSTGSLEIIPDCRKIPKMSMAVGQVETLSNLEISCQNIFPLSSCLSSGKGTHEKIQTTKSRGLRGKTFVLS